MYSIRIPRADLIAKVSFVIFIFSALFGTSVPFESSIQESGEVRTTNMVSVLLYPTLFMLSFIAFIPKSKEILDIIKKEKLLIIFFIWAFLTLGWSQYPMTTFKRWFTQINYLFIPLVFFSYCDSIKDVIRGLKPTIYLYLALSIIVVFIIPGATDPRFGTWRGLAAHKNGLGQAAYLSAIFTSIVFFSESLLLKKTIAIIFFLISIVLLVGANSSTSIIAFALFFAGSILYVAATSFFKSSGAGKFIGVFTFITLVLIFYLFYSMAPDFIDSLNLTGKDLTTMSDRTYLWEYMLFEIAKHPFIGCGFRAFWVVDSVGVQTIWSAFLFMPIQAHNGYLDIMNEGGIISIILLIGIIINYFITAFKNGGLNLWSWFITLTLVINVSETTLFREGHKTFVFFVLAYLITFVFNKGGEKINLNYSINR